MVKKYVRECVCNVKDSYIPPDFYENWNASQHLMLILYLRWNSIVVGPYPDIVHADIALYILNVICKIQHSMSVQHSCICEA